MCFSEGMVRVCSGYSSESTLFLSCVSISKEEEKPESSCVYAKSDWSMDRPINMKHGYNSDDRR